MVGLGGLEPPTSRLSGVRSNQAELQAPRILLKNISDLSEPNSDVKLLISFLRKEVIQPLVPQRLPCYDFTPIIGHTLGVCLPYGLARQLLVHPTLMV